MFNRIKDDIKKMTAPEAGIVVSLLIIGLTVYGYSDRVRTDNRVRNCSSLAHQIVNSGNPATTKDISEFLERCEKGLDAKPNPAVK